MRPGTLGQVQAQRRPAGRSAGRLPHSQDAATCEPRTHVCATRPRRPQSSSRGLRQGRAGGRDTSLCRGDGLGLGPRTTARLYSVRWRTHGRREDIPDEPLSKTCAGYSDL